MSTDTDQEEKKKAPHGGRRVGAGRPRSNDPTIPIGTRIRASTVKRLNAMIDTAITDEQEPRSVTLSRVVADAVDEYVDRHPQLPAKHIRK